MVKRGIINNLFFVLKHIWRWDKKMYITIGLQSLSTALAPFIWVFTPKFVIDELMNEKRIEKLILILVIAVTTSIIIHFSIPYLNGVYKMKISRIRFNFINMMHEKAMSMDYKHTENPEVLNKIHAAWRTARNPFEGIGGVLQKLFSIFGNLIGFTGFVTIILFLHPGVLLVLLATVSITYYMTVKVKEFERSKRDEQFEYERRRRYTNRTMSDFQYGKDIRIYGMKKILMEEKRKYDGKILNIISQVQRKSFWAGVVDGGLILVREGIIYAYLIFKVLVEGLSIGNFSMYVATVRQFATWMQNLMEDMAFLKISCLYIDDYRDFLEIKDKDCQEKRREIPVEKPYEIQFENVSFHYPSSDRYIFKNLSLTIKAGQKLAIVGINGAGKTTFVKLLTRLYQPSEGEILLNGININEFDQREYYNILSVVFQEIKTFAFSIGENIGFDEQNNLNFKRLNEATEKAGIKEKIDSLDKGIDTMMLKVIDSYGIELSGGENQKLALARALYKGGEIVILDEPTSALDPLAEYNIYKSFNEMVMDKTAIFISHRLSSTRFCDVIAMFENGEIIEYGTHDELIEKGQQYAHMFNIQSQYYREDALKKEA